MAVLVLAGVLAGCVRPWPGGISSSPATALPAQDQPAGDELAQQDATATPFPARKPGSPVDTPTPDAPHALPTAPSEEQSYTVQPNDSLGLISRRFNVDLQSLIDANQLDNPDVLEVGQVLRIPPPDLSQIGPDFKILPDSELVAGPASADFDAQAFIAAKNGYLSRYEGEIEDETFSGAQILVRVSREYSVNPRLLLAVLEYETGWVTRKDVPDESRDYPVGLIDPARKGLYKQLAWAANNLNLGYYLWRANAVSYWLLADQTVAPVAPTINAGTAGVQHMLAMLWGREDWEKVAGPDGLQATYWKLFGYPFDYTVEPLLPKKLKQPRMQLPFADGDVWSFTGGPHGGWGDGSGWAAIDFAPPGDALGCVENDAWVTAVADGVIVRSDHGVVLLDLDGDGKEQTGWVVLYLHIATAGRVKLGKIVQAGDRIGHASCEGGVSNGTHVHLARRYNGEWIPADGSLPFNLDGWVSEGAGVEYNGFLKKDGQSIEAWDRRLPENQIER